jgi:uncharacterized membrane protein
MSLMPLLAHAGDIRGWFPLDIPPPHPILVNFTAALVPVSLLSDVLGRLLRRPSFTAAGWWTLLYAAAVTPLTAVAGWLWLRQMPGMDDAPMTVHKWLGTALAVALVALVLWRWRTHRRAGAVPTWPYLASAAVVVILLTVQGHLGGSMSFGDSGGGGGSGTTAPQRTEQPGHVHANAPGGAAAGGGGLEWRDHLDLKDKDKP